MVGITLPDDTTEVAESSCSNTTVASSSSSSSESYLAMEIFSTGSSCICTDDYINLPCSRSINSSKSTLDAEDMTTISDSPLSTSTSNSSYNDKASCDNTKTSNRTCDEESSIHQSTDNGSRSFWFFILSKVKEHSCHFIRHSSHHHLGLNLIITRNIRHSSELLMIRGLLLCWWILQLRLRKTWISSSKRTTLAHLSKIFINV